MTKSWGYGLGSRLTLGLLALFIFALAAFFLSLPTLIGQSDHSADWIIYLVALVFIIFGIFIAFALTGVLRTRISLDGTTFDALLPGHRSLLLIPTFRNVRMPVTDIRSVERREEVVRILGLTSLRESLSIVTTSGERIGLFSNATTALIKLPLGEIASALASAADVAVTDGGTVETGASGLYGEASSTWTERPLDAPAADKARKRAALTMQVLVALVMATFVIRACTSH